MTFDPSKWFIGSLDFLGSLVPGAFILYLLWFAAVAGGFGFNLSPEWTGEWPSTTMEWAAFLVASFIIGRLAHPPAHILNKLYNRTYRQWRRSEGDPLLDYAIKAAGSNVGPKDSIYAWAKSEVAAADLKQAAVVDIMEGTSKMFRTLSFLAIVAAILSIINYRAWFLSSALIVTALLSFLVFSERRFAATKEVYQSLKRVKHKPSQELAAKWKASVEKDVD
jgi:hypothetical protein